MARTIVEKILSAKAGRDAAAGDIVVCRPDLVIGTDGSTPMAIDCFDAMGGDRLNDAGSVLLALDHYSPPSSLATARFHDRIRRFAVRHGVELVEVGGGISFQVAVERGRVRPGDLVVGADSHTVTCGALNACAVGVGSSDLAAAMLTGQIWLKVPRSIAVHVTGALGEGVSAKDAGLALVAQLGPDGAAYAALEFSGPGLAALTLEDRLVLANLAVEADAKTAIFPADAQTSAYLGERSRGVGAAVAADAGADYADTIVLDLAGLSPQVAVPHEPHVVHPIAEVRGTAVDMVFIGTCTGGRARDIRAAVSVIEAAGGRLAPGMHLVVTPASRDVERVLLADGTIAKLVEMGAIVTTPGCGACCGTSGVIPGDAMTVLSTANRNFKGRMGNPTASIYLASPETCARAAVAGAIA